MNRVTIRFFATLRERAHASELSREFPEGTTVGEIWQRLVSEFSELSGHHDSVAFAVNHEYVESEFRPRAGDEVAFIPPVSGGLDPDWIGPVRIVHEKIDLAVLEGSVSDPAAGAVVRFDGMTRNENVGRRVLRLDYEAYEPMALNEMRKIAKDAGGRWKIVRIAITHRIGRVDIGEISVAIAVSAAHRADAFAACRFAIDRIKEIVPIWKKEYFEGGEVWVGCQTSHPPRVDA
ncbi:MAG: molybdopterin converting factor subunit 1 [Candidatus Binataceae bacterium]